MTDSEYKQWLRSPSAIKCVLIEVGVNIGGSEEVMYLSNRGYVTSPTDTPPNQSYKPIVRGGLEISSRLNKSGAASISWGDIEISNINGEQDEWKDYIWKNKNISVYLGDLTWERSDFRLIFTGKIDDMLTSSRDSWSFSIRDKLNELNTSITESTLGGTTTNKDRILPLCFGECHNIEPLLIDPVLLKYKVHNGTIEGIIEVRDNGVPVGFTATVADGTFVLTNSPIGTITCSVQGAKFSGVYYNDVGNLVKSIVKTYGITPLTDSDIDLVNFAAFITAHPQPVGIYLDDKSNILSVLGELTASLGAQVLMTPLGKLQLKKIELPSASYSVAIDTKDMRERTFTSSEKQEVQAAVCINYCKNYTVQEGLQTGLPAEHLSMFAKEWLEAKASDATVATNYAITVEANKEDTLLLVTTDAQAEALRRLNLYKVQRYIYSFDSDLSLLLIGLGDYIQVTYPRYGLDTSQIAQVVSINIDWFKNTISFGVLA